MAGTVDYSRKDRVGIITLKRPERANALSRELVGELGRLGRELSEDAELSAIILTGSGQRAFSAGADLKEREHLSESEVLAVLDSYRSELGWLDPCPIPVVAALNGVALGGGLELALMCDLRVMASHAELGFPETGLGIIPGAGGTQRLTRLVGEGRAKELILLGRRVKAAEAHHMGLVNRVSPEGTDVVADALCFIAPILNGAPIAQRAALQAIDAARDADPEQGMLAERRAYERCLVTEDRREALRAIRERRPPRFRGK